MAQTNLVKNPDWAEKLAAHFEAAKRSSFSYGGMDCCLFVADAVFSMTGVDLMVPFRGTYKTAEDIEQIVHENDAKCLTSLIRRHLQQAGFTRKDISFASRGDIALLDEGAMGLIAMDGRRAVVLHPEKGTHDVPLSRITLLWGI